MIGRFACMDSIQLSSIYLPLPLFSFILLAGMQCVANTFVHCPDHVAFRIVHEIVVMQHDKDDKTIDSLSIIEL